MLDSSRERAYIVQVTWETVRADTWRSGGSSSGLRWIPALADTPPSSPSVERPAPEFTHTGEVSEVCVAALGEEYREECRVVTEGGGSEPQEATPEDRVQPLNPDLPDVARFMPEDADGAESSVPPSSSRQYGPVSKVCTEALKAEGRTGDCRVVSESGVSEPRLATAADLEADGDLVAPDGTTLDEAAETSRIYYIVWWQNAHTPVWDEDHDGRYYYEVPALHVWSTNTHRGYLGYHVCGKGSPGQWIVQVAQCSTINGVSTYRIKENDVFDVLGPGVTERWKMTMIAYPDGYKEFVPATRV